jgi:hypothetical protein
MLKALKKALSRYIIIDSFGTYRYCYTLKDAQDWLDYCADNGYIIDRLLGCEIGCNCFPV